MNGIWSTDARDGSGRGRTFREAIEEFARTHWAEPRKARVNDDGQTFQMVGGAGRWYRVDTVKSGAGFPCYVVRVVEA